MAIWYILAKCTLNFLKSEEFQIFYELVQFLFHIYPTSSKLFKFKNKKEQYQFEAIEIIKIAFTNSNKSFRFRFIIVQISNLVCRQTSSKQGIVYCCWKFQSALELGLESIYAHKRITMRVVKIGGGFMRRFSCSWMKEMVPIKIFA